MPKYKIKYQPNYFFTAPRPVGRRIRKPGIDRKPRQAYSTKQLDQLEAEFKVRLYMQKFFLGNIRWWIQEEL